jgi:uncharacterized membrane protein YeaQ/YmgE (transglycosylase-associated protein family)
MSTSITRSELAAEAKSKVHLAVAIIVGCIFGWLAYSYPPKTWRIPEELAHVNAMSSAADLAKLAIVEKSNLWNNSMLKFTMAGLGVALSAFVLNGARNIGGSLSTIFAGAVGGLLAGVVGLVVRQYLDREYPIPLIPQSSRPLFCDTVVFCIISLFLIAPVALLMKTQRNPNDQKRASSVLFGGILTGLLVPFVGALVLPASASTSQYPPVGVGLTVLWFVSLAILTVALAVFREAKVVQPANDAELETA